MGVTCDRNAVARTCRGPAHDVGTVGSCRPLLPAAGLVLAILAAPLLTAPAVASKRKPAPPPPPPSIVPANPGFEDGLKGWCQERPVGFVYGTVSVLEEGAAEGKRSARLEGAPGQSAVGLTCDPVPLPKGGAHLLVRLRYRTAGPVEEARLRVRPLDEKGQALVPLDEFPQTLAPLDAAPEWTSFSRVCFIPAAAAAYDVTLWLRGEGVLCADAIEVRALKAEEFTVPSQAAKIKGAGSDAVAVWYESPLKKVYRDAKPPAAEIPAVSLAAARGESDVFQVVLVPRDNAAGVRVRWQDFLGPGIIRREQGRSAWVDYVNVTRLRSPLARLGWTPDPLSPEDGRDLKGGQVQPVWLTLWVPRDARPGLYRGAVQIESSSRDPYSSGTALPTVRIPVQLQVRAYAMPEESSLTTIARITRCPADGRDAFRQNLRAHRVTGEAYVGPLPVQVSPEGAVSIDFAPFDASMASYRSTGLRLLNMPETFLGDARGFFDEGGTWHGLKVLSPEFNQAFASYIHQVAAHLRERGWLADTIVQLWDEPADEDARLLHGRLAALARAAAPDLRICLAAAPDARLLADVDVWNAPLPDGLAAPLAAARRAAGKVVWAHDDRLYSLDVDASSMDMRAYPWRLRRNGIAGAEWWSVSEWLGNPYREPDRCGAQYGGGFLLYPPKEGVGGPLDSIRWELYREGVEDYDALALLAQAHTAACKRLQADARLFGVDALLDRIGGRVALTAADCSRNPRDLFSARELADLLIELAGAETPCVTRFVDEGKKVFLSGLTIPGGEVRFGESVFRADSAGRLRFPLPDEWRPPAPAEPAGKQGT